ncbi:MAG: 2-amino-4-hydroxy-6-hydroxymethyldihydropteridine diphosphokinase [Flavobacteriales bacterium]
MEALLLLGGNIGDPLATLSSAIGLLGSGVGEVLSVSRDHWTEPWGFEDERLFLNKAVLLRTERSPTQLMDECLRIEKMLGRSRKEGSGYGSRPIDIDILLIGDSVIDEPALRVPHPLMHERSFALAPAADVAPGLVHPLKQRSVLALLNDLVPYRGAAQGQANISG